MLKEKSTMIVVSSSSDELNKSNHMVSFIGGSGNTNDWFELAGFSSDPATFVQFEYCSIRQPPPAMISTTSSRFNQIELMDLSVLLTILFCSVFVLLVVSLVQYYRGRRRRAATSSMAPALVSTQDVVTPQRPLTKVEKANMMWNAPATREETARAMARAMEGKSYEKRLKFADTGAVKPEVTGVCLIPSGEDGRIMPNLSNQVCANKKLQNIAVAKALSIGIPMHRFGKCLGNWEVQEGNDLEVLLSSQATRQISVYDQFTSQVDDRDVVESNKQGNEILKECRLLDEIYFNSHFNSPLVETLVETVTDEMDTSTTMDGCSLHPDLSAGESWMEPTELPKLPSSATTHVPASPIAPVPSEPLRIVPLSRAPSFKIKAGSSKRKTQQLRPKPVAAPAESPMPINNATLNDSNLGDNLLGTSSLSTPPLPPSLPLPPTSVTTTMKQRLRKKLDPETSKTRLLQAAKKRRDSISTLCQSGSIVVLQERCPVPELHRALKTHIKDRSWSGLDSISEETTNDADSSDNEDQQSSWDFSSILSDDFDAFPDGEDSEQLELVELSANDNNSSRSPPSSNEQCVVRRSSRLAGLSNVEGSVFLRKSERLSGKAPVSYKGMC